jgi:hypothetical protein
MLLTLCLPQQQLIQQCISNVLNNINWCDAGVSC